MLGGNNSAERNALWNNEYMNNQFTHILYLWLHMKLYVLSGNFLAEDVSSPYTNK